MDSFKLCIIKPNKDAFSETFIQEHINRLSTSVKVLYGGSFPLYDDNGQYIIKSKLGLLSYLVQKKLLKKKDIRVRTNALAAYLKRNKIEVVLAEYGMVGAMVSKACQKAGVPLVIHYHGADVHHRKTVQDYLPFYRQSFLYAYALVVVSNDMAKTLSTLGAPSNKIKLNPYGVDISKFSLVDIKSTPKNFISIGRFVEKKSPLSVIEAFKMVTDRFSDAHLSMVGAGPLLQEAKYFAEEANIADKVTFYGVQTVSQIILLIRQSRCFVQHSVTARDGDMEGTPNSILEAGASGLAIVSTRHAGIKEAVIDGETGYLVDEHDITGMANYMIKFAEDVDLAAEMGAKEAEHIRKNYDINDRIKTLTAILRQAIKEN